jgi:hypothetical protein
MKDANHHAQGNASMSTETNQAVVADDQHAPEHVTEQDTMQDDEFTHHLLEAQSRLIKHGMPRRHCSSLLWIHAYLMDPEIQTPDLAWVADTLGLSRKTVKKLIDVLVTEGLYIPKSQGGISV